MGQTTNERRVKDNEAMAMAKFLRTSPGKLNLVAAMIRGKAAGRALTDLQFSNRRIAQDVRKVLASAVANAENNHNLDVDKLVVAEAYVGKSVKMRRFNARARGRAAPIEKHFSRLTIVVREGEAKAAPKKAAVKKAAAPKAEAAEKPAAKKAAAKKPAAKKAATKQDKE
ncbi:MAG: 50S ribosomal protein L22 [Micavibrio aeruginosavorus]|uniref:Large ribosomal subunit protein uL22 n=1 Tax=Micavibrio aeruginosavorus TaxID=349221 RepID=A0A2W4ZRZ6_9BACT|nr:MAG: 50S ribosomal protein L22 [Micavibrio aeruginosavorus]